MTVFYKCPHCGNEGYNTKGEGHCHKCGKPVVRKKAIKMDVTCPCCGEKHHGVNVGRNYIWCFKCKAPIDIVYHKKRNCMIAM